MSKPLEIERKFLVKQEFIPYLQSFLGEDIKQGYLLSDINKTVRIRIKGSQAYLTVKSKSESISRIEVESPIALDAANQLFEHFISEAVIKIRRHIQVGEHTWEVDEFFGNLAGLWIAEVELKSEEEKFEMPHWASDEVSYDKSYFNSFLLKNGLQGVRLH